MKAIVAISFVLCLFGLPSAAQSPEDTVRWIYTSLSGNGPASQQGLEALASPTQRSTYFTQRMVAFYDANDSYGDDLALACVDFGFSVPGQDYDAAEIARSLRLSTRSTDPGRATVIAEFTTFGQPARVVYDFASEGGYFKIDDIAGEGFRVSEIPCTPKTASVPPPVTSTSYCFQNDSDSLRLDVFSETAARLEFLSVQSNGHSCYARMEGRQVAAGWDFHAEQGCLVQVRIAADGGVELGDADNVCKFMMCGQRAVIDGLHFPHIDRIDCSVWRALGN